jgi:hypothetical protein
MAALVLRPCDEDRFCRAFGFGHRKPAPLAFERAHVFGEGAPDDLQDHRSAANRAADFITGCEILAHYLLMHAMAHSGLDVDQPTDAGKPLQQHLVRRIGR